MSEKFIVFYRLIRAVLTALFRSGTFLPEGRKVENTLYKIFEDTYNLFIGSLNTHSSFIIIVLGISLKSGNLSIFNLQISLFKFFWNLYSKFEDREPRLVLIQSFET